MTKSRDDRRQRSRCCECGRTVIGIPNMCDHCTYSNPYHRRMVILGRLFDAAHVPVDEPGAQQHLELIAAGEAP